MSVRHPSLTAMNLSYTFPILETSATALCGTTGIGKWYRNVSYLLVGGIGLASSSPRSRAAPTIAELCSCFCQQVFSYNPVASRDHCQSITTCFSGNGGFMKMVHEHSWVSSLSQVLSRFHLVQLELAFETENLRSLFTFKWLHTPWNQGAPFGILDYKTVTRW